MKGIRKYPYLISPPGRKKWMGVKVEVPRWQHAEFIVMTTGPHLQRGTRHSDQLHPQRLEHDAPGTPWDFALNPFLESVLIVAYNSGDFSLFDTETCVPIAHWPMCVPAMTKTCLAWSPVRPGVCLLFAGARSSS